MARTDVHSPVNLVTEDYEYLFSAVNSYPWMRKTWVQIMGDYGLEISRKIHSTPLGENRSTSQCHHCGAHINYFAVLEHKPTGELIAVGEQCLSNRFDPCHSGFSAAPERYSPQC